MEKILTLYNDLFDSYKTIFKDVLKDILLGLENIEKNKGKKTLFHNVTQDYIQKALLKGTEEMKRQGLTDEEIESIDNEEFYKEALGITNVKEQKGGLVSISPLNISKAFIDMSIVEEKMTKKVVFSSEKMKIIQNKIELFFSAYKRENELSLIERLSILKSLKIELFVNTKKELLLANSRLVKTLQNINDHILVHPVGIAASRASEPKDSKGSF